MFIVSNVFTRLCFLYPCRGRKIRLYLNSFKLIDFLYMNFFKTSWNISTKFAATNPMPTKFMNLDYGKRRNFIKVNSLQTGELQLQVKSEKFSSSRQNGGMIMYRKYATPIPSWQMRNSNFHSFKVFNWLKNYCFDFSESRALIGHYGKGGACVHSPTMNKLRINFWMEKFLSVGLAVPALHIVN